MRRMQRHIWHAPGQFKPFCSNFLAYLLGAWTSNLNHPMNGGPDRNWKILTNYACPINLPETYQWRSKPPRPLFSCARPGASFPNRLLCPAKTVLEARPGSGSGFGGRKWWFRPALCWWLQGGPAINTHHICTEWEDGWPFMSRRANRPCGCLLECRWNAHYVQPDIQCPKGETTKHLARRLHTNKTLHDYSTHYSLAHW